MGNYTDHSAVIVDAPTKAANAQQALIGLGMDLGHSGADGNWGPKSLAAAKNWQEINGYEATGRITERQMDALNFQVEHPSVFHRMQLKPFYENFDQNIIPTDDPVRKAMFLQAASHIGAKESGGENQGPAVEQYLSSDGRMSTAASWCAAFGGWDIDQVEDHAGVNRSDYMEANMRVQELYKHIENTSPNAIKSLNDYAPQTGDMLLKLRPDGTGHYAMVVDSFRGPNGDTAILTIDGNVNDMVAPTDQLVTTDLNSGKSFFVVTEDVDDPDTWYTNPEEQMVVVDISELPNYDRMQAGFNANSTFVPTPSSDPNFELDLDLLAQLQETMQLYQDQKEPKIPILTPLAPNADFQMSTAPQTPFNPTPG